MCEQAEAEDVHVTAGHDKIPEKVSSGHGLHQPACTSVTPYPASPIHVPPLVIEDDNISGQQTDDDRLAQRHDMDVPVDARARVEVRVGLWTQAAAEVGGDDDIDEAVEGEGEDDLVDMYGESW